MPAVGALTNKIDVSTTRNFSEVKKGYTPFATGDVIFAKITPCMENGKCAVVPKLEHDLAYGSTEFHVVRPRGKLNPFWFYFFLSSQSYRSFAEHNMTGAVGQRRVPTDFIARSSIPLPPLKEQKRIVAKIEELFSELDAGEESLRRARQQLGIYRQSLLKQAFEGKLTAHWRGQNLGECTLPAWREVVIPDVLTSKPSNGRSVKDRVGGYRVLRLTAIKDGVIDLNENKEGDWDENEASRYKVRDGDFLASRGNGSIKLVGRGGIVRGEMDVAFPDTMIRLPLDQSIVFPPYFTHLWNSSQVRLQIESSAQTTAGIYKINQGSLSRYRFPLCSYAEQQEIVRLLDEQFSVIAQNECEIDSALKRSAALRQSILKEAFSGQLVPQDASDEPASVLLARIRGERESTPAKKRNARKKSEDLPVPVKPTEKEWFTKIIPFKPLGRTDLQAGIVALAVNAFVEADQFIGHTITEKIVHLSDYIADLNLDRHPIKDVAGPNDYKKAKAVEHRAKMKGWFTVQKKGDFYLYDRGRHLDRLLEDTRRTLGAKLSLVEDLLKAMIRFDTHKAEVFATVYAAWNNLLLQGHAISDEAIVTEARENWHPSKLKIGRESFFKAITWMRRKGFVPKGTGHLVGKKSASAK